MVDKPGERSAVSCTSAQEQQPSFAQMTGDYDAVQGSSGAHCFALEIGVSPLCRLPACILKVTLNHSLHNVLAILLTVVACSAV